MLDPFDSYVNEVHYSAHKTKIWRNLTCCNIDCVMSSWNPIHWYILNLKFKYKSQLAL
jgi:hypothetical protein